MEKPGYFQARFNSFGYAFKGIATLISSQPNARLHLLATIVVIVSGFVLEVNAGEWAVLIIAISIVWLAEGLNTAVEFIVDLVSPDHHELAGKAKDVAAGAVLLAAMGAAGIASLVFIPRLLALL